MGSSSSKHPRYDPYSPHNPYYHPVPSSHKYRPPPRPHYPPVVERPRRHRSMEYSSRRSYEHERGEHPYISRSKSYRGPHRHKHTPYIPMENPLPVPPKDIFAKYEKKWNLPPITPFPSAPPLSGHGVHDHPFYPPPPPAPFGAHWPPTPAPPLHIPVPSLVPRSSDSDDDTIEPFIPPPPRRGRESTPYAPPIAELSARMSTKSKKDSYFRPPDIERPYAPPIAELSARVSRKSKKDSHFRPPDIEAPYAPPIAELSARVSKKSKKDSHFRPPDIEPPHAPPIAELSARVSTKSRKDSHFRPPVIEPPSPSDMMSPLPEHSHWHSTPIIPMRSIGPPSPGPILFHPWSELYSGFSLTSNHQVVHRGKIYPTAAHVLEARKYLKGHKKIAEKLRFISEKDGIEAALYDESARYHAKARKDWPEVAITKLEDTLKSKFSQHSQLQAELLATQGAHLILHSDDPYLGSGHDGRGRNVLGIALMELRDKLYRKKH